MSKATERRRHEALAREIGAWRSWAVERWFTDGSMAFVLDEPFSLPNKALEFECACEFAHPWNAGDDCMFVDTYEDDPGIHAVLVKALRRYASYDHCASVSVDRERTEHAEESGLTYYTARIDGERHPKAWVAVQDRYVDAVCRHARPTRWLWMAQAPSDPPSLPIIAALRGDQIVGFVMPLVCPGSAIEPQSVGPTFTGRSMLPPPVEAVS